MKHFGVVLTVAALSLAGCGQEAGSQSGATQHRTIEVGRSDTGSTVSLDVGDRLELVFGSSASSEGWRLLVYPKKALSLQGPSRGNRLTLEARHSGEGRVVAVDPSQMGACSGTKLGRKTPLQCAMLGSEGGVPPRPGVFGLIVTVK